jgi:hypothetical protein
MTFSPVSDGSGGHNTYQLNHENRPSGTSGTQKKANIKDADFLLKSHFGFITKNLRLT